MSRVLRLRRGTTAETSSFAGKLAEVTVDTTDWALVVHDGTTLGGHRLATESYVENNKAVTSSGTTAPVDATAGSMWFDTNSGRLYVYYDNVWIDASPTVSSGNIGNLSIDDTTISSINADANINLSANGNGVIKSTSVHRFSNTGVRLGTMPITGNSYASLRVNLSNGFPQSYDRLSISTTHNGNANVAILISSNTETSMFFNPQTGKIGVNKFNPFYTFDVAGSVGSRGFYTLTGNTSGYQFQGDGVNATTGLIYEQIDESNSRLSFIQQGNVTFSSYANNHTTISGNLAIGQELNFLPTNAKMSYGDDVAGFTQFAMQNKNSGAGSSTDIALFADNGDDSVNYVDMGITSSTYNDPAYSLYGPNDAYLINASGNGSKLILNTYNDSDIVFATGGGTAANEIARFQNGEGLVMHGNVIPASNVAYNLGAPGNEWNSLYVSNNTIYLGGIPLSIDNANNLTVDGNPVGSGALAPSSSAPGSASDGQLWFDVEDGHLYVRYANVWIDTTISGSGGSTATDRLTANGREAILETSGTLTIPGFISSNNPDTGIESVTDGNTTGLYLNSNKLAAGGAILYATNNVLLRADNNGVNKDWTFSNDGSTQFPNYSFPAAAGTDGQILVIDSIGRFSFENPAIDANNLTGSTLASGVTDSSLTSVGTLTGLTSSGVVHITNTEDSTNADTGSLQVDGGAHITKNLIAEGTIYAGVDAYTEALTNPLMVASSPSGVGGGYSQVALLNNTAEASGDFQVFVDGYDKAVSDTGYVDLGMAGSNFNDPAFTITGPQDGYVFVSAREGGTGGGSLVLATDENGSVGDIIFGTGGFATENEKMRLKNSDGSLNIVSGLINSDSDIALKAGDSQLSISNLGGVLFPSNLSVLPYQTVFPGVPFDGTIIAQLPGDVLQIAALGAGAASGIGWIENVPDGSSIPTGGLASVTASSDRSVTVTAGAYDTDIYTWTFDEGGVFNLPETVGDIKKGGVSVLSGAYVLPKATTSVLGGVKADGVTTTVDGAGVISAVLNGAVIFKGTWNAATNTPALSSSLPAGVTTGWQYLVSVTGTRDIGDGSQTYTAGDIVVYDGTKWNDIPGAAGSVSSFNNRTGAVSLSSGDVTGALGFTPIQKSSLSNVTASASGSGAFAYDNSTGVMTFTPPLNVSGTAGSAATLTTARNINGVAFNGSGDITVTANAGTLTGGTLNSGVTQSSLTAVGTLVNLTVTNTIQGNISGSASKLLNARNINGVSFDGTADITVPSTYGDGNVATYLPTYSGNIAANNIAATRAITSGGNAVVTVGDTGTVTNTMLAGSITNAKLANSSMTLNGTTVALGGTATIGSIPDTIVTPVQSGTTTITNAMSRIVFINSSSVTQQFVVLPDTNTCYVGQTFEIMPNQQNYAWTVQLYGGGSSGKTWTGGMTLKATVVAQRGGSAESAANWAYNFSGLYGTTGTGSTVLSTAPVISNATLSGGVDMSGTYALLGQVGEKFSTWNYTIGGVTAVPTAIANTSGSFTIPSTSGISVGQTVTITGTNTGTGTISGYSSGTVYYVVGSVLVGGATNIQLAAARNTSLGVTTTVGTLVGLTMTFGPQVSVNPYSGAGHIVNVTGTINANFDVAFQSINQTSAAYSLTVIINQGATPRMINNFYTGSYSGYMGNAATISWVGGVTPTGNANKKDVITLKWLPSTQYTPTIVLGQLQSYG